MEFIDIARFWRSNRFDDIGSALLNTPFDVGPASRLTREIESFSDYCTCWTADGAARSAGDNIIEQRSTAGEPARVRMFSQNVFDANMLLVS